MPLLHDSRSCSTLVRWMTTDTTATAVRMMTPQINILVRPSNRYYCCCSYLMLFSSLTRIHTCLSERSDLARYAGSAARQMAREILHFFTRLAGICNSRKTIFCTGRQHTSRLLLLPQTLFCAMLVIIQPIQDPKQCGQFRHGHMQGQCLSLYTKRA